MSGDRQNVDLMLQGLFFFLRNTIILWSFFFKNNSEKKGLRKHLISSGVLEEAVNKNKAALSKWIN